MFASCLFFSAKDLCRLTRFQVFFEKRTRFTVSTVVSKRNNFDQKTVLKSPGSPSKKKRSLQPKNLPTFESDCSSFSLYVTCYCTSAVCLKILNTMCSNSVLFLFYKTGEMANVFDKL